MQDDALMTAAESLLEAEKSLERALSAGHNRPDRLPGLQMIFGQLPRIMVDELESLSPLPVKVHLIELFASTIADTCTLPPGAYAGVTRAERWRSWLYFMTDPAATLLFVEAATGCEAISPAALLPRKTTRTDANVLRVLFRRVARSLASAFSILADIEFEVGDVVDEIELEPNLGPTSPVIAARLSLDYDGYIGTLTLVIPQAALESIRNLLVSPTQGDGASASSSTDAEEDPAWSRQLAEEIARAFIEVNGILEERPIALSEVQRFGVGSVIELQLASMSRIRLDADENPLFWCELGKRENELVLRVEEGFNQRREAVDEFYGL
jgi:flagellar motor switch protein FliM